MYNMVIYDFLAKKGGPSGYLYNLKDCNKLNIISRGILSSEELNKKKIKKFLFIRTLLEKVRNIFRRNKKREKFFIKNKEILEKSLINHFHTTTTFNHAIKLLNLNNINILMTHSPQPTYLELKDALFVSKLSNKEQEKRVNKQKEVDIFSLKNANYVIFPCKEAISPYETFFKEIDFDYSKLRYVLTGVEPLLYNLNKNEFCKKNDIPLDKKIISYIGRKNKIKGFDKFLDLVKRFEHREDILFICAGVGMDTPSSKNLVDFGWTNDPGSIINASDFVLVPNRDTYFDINMIQILSIGTPVITTPTGGNRWFQDKENLNMFFFEDEKQLDILINEKITLTFDKKINIDFYNNHFTIEDFSKNYVSLFDDLVNKYEKNK